MSSPSRGAMRPRLASLSPSPNSRGRREDRVRAAPAVSCANCTKESAHEHTGSAEAIRPSLRSGFTAYFVISPVTGFLATVTSLGLAPTNLAPASGRQDHTTSPSASRTLVFRALSASTASHRNVRDDRDPPLLSGETGRGDSADLPDGLSGIFLRAGLDRVLLICPSGCFAAAIPATSSLRANGSAH